jgi:hypothetical protein
MGEIRPPSKVVLLIAASSRYEQALALARQQSEARFGPTAAVSEPFAFSETNYYAEEMGAGLKKQFWAFDEPIDPARLADQTADQCMGSGLRRTPLPSRIAAAEPRPGLPDSCQTGARVD